MPVPTWLPVGLYHFRDAVLAAADNETVPEPQTFPGAVDVMFAVEDAHSFITVLEFAQVWIPTRSPGLTDPAIALLAGALLWTVDRRFGHATTTATPL